MSKNEYIESPSKQLAVGVAALLAGSCLMFIVLMIVAMTPDPNHQINYTMVAVIEAILFMITCYGGYKLEKLSQFLQLCERTTEVWQLTKNSQEEQTSQSGPNSMQKPRLEK